MRRRTFLQFVGAASIAPTALDTGPPVPAATLLYNDGTTSLSKIRRDPTDPAALWVRKRDLPRINDFELKPRGACRADICIPIAKDMIHGDYFNLTGFARKIRQALVVDSEAVSGALARFKRSAAAFSTDASRPMSPFRIAKPSRSPRRFPWEEGAPEDVGVLVRMPTRSARLAEGVHRAERSELRDRRRRAGRWG